MYPNLTCEIANYVIYPEKGTYALFLHSEFIGEGENLERCLAVASTVEELINFIALKQGDLYNTDILIKNNGNRERAMVSDYCWVTQQENDFWAIFMYKGDVRKFVEEQQNIDKLVQKYNSENIIISL
jgi:hypothetical protein